MNNYDGYFTIGSIIMSLWLLKKYFFKPTISETKLIYSELSPDRNSYNIFTNETLRKATIIIELDHRETDTFKIQFIYGTKGNYKILDLYNHGREIIEVMPTGTISAMNFALIPIGVRLNIQFSVDEYQVTFT